MGNTKLLSKDKARYDKYKKEFENFCREDLPNLDMSKPIEDEHFEKIEIENFIETFVEIAIAKGFIQCKYDLHLDLDLDDESSIEMSIKECTEEYNGAENKDCFDVSTFLFVDCEEFEHRGIIKDLTIASIHQFLDSKINNAKQVIKSIYIFEGRKSE